MIPLYPAIFSATLILVALILTGCGDSGSRNRTQGFPAKPAIAESLPTAENRNYANWTLFPVGTSVKKVKLTKNPQDWVKETTTTRLLEKTPAKVVIETQVTVERPNYETQVNPGMKIEIFATFQVPNGLTAEQILAPSLKAKKTGEEEITILDKKEKASVYTWEDGTESGPMKNKAWYCETIPGRLVKQEMVVEQKGFNAKEDIVEITIPTVK